jgi:hypothetical protein
MSPNTIMKQLQNKFDIVQQDSPSLLLQQSLDGGNSPSPIRTNNEEEDDNGEFH